MPQMNAVQIRSPGGPFEVVKREIPDPGPNQIRIKVQACGICHNDVFVRRDIGRGCNTRVSPVTKWLASLTRSAV